MLETKRSPMEDQDQADEAGNDQRGLAQRVAVTLQHLNMGCIHYFCFDNVCSVQNSNSVQQN